MENIGFLLKYNLKEREEDLKIDILDAIEGIYLYELKDYEKNLRKLNVLDSRDTLALLSNNPKSFCRFGDGEVELMKGNDIQFQKYDARLADILLEILKNNDDNLYVGLTHGYFTPISRKSSDFVRRWSRLYISGYRDFFVNHCNLERTYIDAAFNQVLNSESRERLDSYYNEIKKMFSGRDLVIFVGEGVLDKLKYDVFELANSKEFVYGPSKNSFEQFDFLLKKALTYPKDKTLIFILGPCSKALCYYLSKEGRMAWDLGHLAKAYDFHMSGKETTSENIALFYRAD